MPTLNSGPRPNFPLHFLLHVQSWAVNRRGLLISPRNCRGVHVRYSHHGNGHAEHRRRDWRDNWGEQSINSPLRIAAYPIHPQRLLWDAQTRSLFPPVLEGQQSLRLPSSPSCLPSCGIWDFAATDHHLLRLRAGSNQRKSELSS